MGKFEFDVVDVTRKPSTIQSVVKDISSSTAIIPDPFLRLHLMVVVQLGCEQLMLRQVR
jgi:hypothetical protein